MRPAHTLLPVPGAPRFLGAASPTAAEPKAPSLLGLVSGLPAWAGQCSTECMHWLAVANRRGAETSTSSGNFTTPTVRPASCRAAHSTHLWRGSGACRPPRRQQLRLPRPGVRTWAGGRGRGWFMKGCLIRPACPVHRQNRALKCMLHAPPPQRSIPPPSLQQPPALPPAAAHQSRSCCARASFSSGSASSASSLRGQGPACTWCHRLQGAVECTRGGEGSCAADVALENWDPPPLLKCHWHVHPVLVANTTPVHCPAEQAVLRICSWV